MQAVAAAIEAVHQPIGDDRGMGDAQRAGLDMRTGPPTAFAVAVEDVRVTSSGDATGEAAEHDKGNAAVAPSDVVGERCRGEHPPVRRIDGDEAPAAHLLPFVVA